MEKVIWFNDSGALKQKEDGTLIFTDDKGKEYTVQSGPQEKRKIANYARDFVICKKIPPDEYKYEVMDYLEKNDCPIYALELGKAILAENKAPKKERLKKEILPRADQLKEYNTRANRHCFLWRLINHTMYKIACWSIRREINRAIRHRKNSVFFLTNAWQLCYFPELIDRLEYLGYEVKKSYFGNWYEIKWEL